jgi:glycosyltransferase involved in cell wall biosynthesis
MRRRVLFLTSSYPTPEFPALGIFVKEHARAAATQADVAVVHVERAEGVRRLHVSEVRGEEFPTWRIAYPHSPALLSYVGNVAAGIAGFRRARRAGFDPDVLHAHFFLAAIPAVVLGRAFRKPVVVTEQWSVFLPDDPATLAPLVRRVAKLALERADVVMPVSEALRDGIAAAGIDARFRVVPNVFDDVLFHPPRLEARAEGPARLLSVGALYAAKGWEYLLEAVGLLRDQGRAVRLDIVGDGDLRPQYEALRARLGLEEIVLFQGWRTKPEIAELMRAADLFVLASRYDSNPCAVIEALGSGLPVVATAVGGLPGMVTPGSGLLAQPHNAGSIATQIGAALDALGSFDGAQIAERARERYGVRQVGAAFGEVYREVTA